VTDFCGAEAVFEYTLNYCEHDLTVVFNAVNQCLDGGWFDPQPRLILGKIITSPSSVLQGTSIYVEWTNPEGEVLESGYVGLAFQGSYYTISGSLERIEIDDNSPGEYCVTIRDAFGCITTACKNFGMATNPAKWVGRAWIHPVYGYIISDYGVEPFTANYYYEECGTCNIPFLNENDCLNSEDILREPLRYVPTDPNNPCGGGGMIHLAGANPLLTIDVPPNWTSSLFQRDNRCACYFPAGTIAGIGSATLPFPIYPGSTLDPPSWPVYVEFNCQSNIDPPTPPQSEGLCPTECTCMVEDNESVCSYDYVCIETGELITEIPGTSIVCILRRPGGICDLVDVCYENCTVLELLLEDISCDMAVECPACLTSGSDQAEQAFLGDSTEKATTSAPTLTTRRSKNEGDETFESIVYPNPFDKKLYVSLTSQTNSKVQMSVYDVAVRPILLRNINVDAGHHLEAWDTDFLLPAGMYQLLIETDRGHRTIHRIIHLKE